MAFAPWRALSKNTAHRRQPSIQPALSRFRSLWTAPIHGSNIWIKEDNRRQFRQQGYTVVRNVVPSALTGNAVREITAFVGADLIDGATWYGGAEVLDGIVPLHHAQSLWDIRQCPNLYEVFREFHKTPQLFVDINRCIFRPPVHPDFPTRSYGTIHWDMDPRLPGPGALQAVVLLTDVRRNGGGFQCLPEIYRNLQTWLAGNARRADFDFFNPGLNRLETTQVEGDAGDVILWSTKLPHGSASNFSTRPRLGAFVSMAPPAAWAHDSESLRRWWLTKRVPECWRGLPGQLEPEPGAPAVLSDLGLKLIGAQPW